jgi:hypothetical protein
MAAKENKVLYIQSSAHAIVGRSGQPADTLEPGGRTLFDENIESHKFLQQAIEAGDPSVAHLSLVEVDAKAEQAQQEEQQEKLAEAEQIAAAARDEQLQAALEAQEGTGDTKGIEGDQPPVPQVEDVNLPPQDEEAVSIAEQSGAGQRASTQDDVAKEDQPSKSGRRSSRKSG